MRRMGLLMATILALATSAQASTRVEGVLPTLSVPESTPGLETLLTEVEVAPGVRLRVFLTRPDGATGPLPAIFYTQPVVCGTAAWPADQPRTLKALATRSGLATIRVERRGVGDSQGAPCSELDWETEVSDYRAALSAMRRHPWINGDRIVVYGASLGATTAPFVAQGMNVAGVMMHGGGALTHLERMILFDRLNLERAGAAPPDGFPAEMARRIAFHRAYLMDRLTPAQVEAAHPELRGVSKRIRGLETAPHYGRPYAWHWQLAARDVFAAWRSLQAPVLVAYAEYDQFETEHSTRLIVDQLNREHPGRATWVFLPGLDHSFNRYADPFAAYGEEGGQRDAEPFVEAAIKWLRKVTAA